MMSLRNLVPLVAAISVAGMLALLPRHSDQKATDAITSPVTPDKPDLPLVFVSHDWIEMPIEAPKPGLPTLGADPTATRTCTIPKCRNCVIHAVWMQSL